MKHILVYGSLRKHSKRGYNFNCFEGQTYLKDVQLEGFELYALCSYPAICRGTGTLHCELHSVEDESFKYINWMEEGAGYTPLLIPVDHEGEMIDATIYVYPRERLADRERVLSGNWD